MEVVFEQLAAKWNASNSEDGGSFASIEMIRKASEYQKNKIFKPSKFEEDFLIKSLEYRNMIDGIISENIFPKNLQVSEFVPNQKLDIAYKLKKRNYRHVFLIPYFGILFLLAILSHMGSRAGNSWAVMILLGMAFIYSIYDKLALLKNEKPIIEFDLYQRRVNVRGGVPKRPLDKPKDGDVLIQVGKTQKGYFATIVYGSEFEIYRTAPKEGRKEAINEVKHFANTLNRAMGLSKVRITEYSDFIEPNVIWK